MAGWGLWREVDCGIVDSEDWGTRVNIEIATSWKDETVDV